MSECANPQLLEWVNEWVQEARNRNSKGLQTYKKAYDSLKACPLSFSHPCELQQLNGFGPKLCERLTTKLKAHCEENGIPMPEMPQKARKRSTKDQDDDGEEAPAKKPKKVKQYVPVLRSGPYAIILALSTLDENAPNGITKPEIVELAQPHCDSSFTVPIDTNSFYTAWSSMATLIKKDLVYERGRPTRKYALTEEGWDAAKQIRKTHDPNQGRLDNFTGTQKSPPKKSTDNTFVSLEESPVSPSGSRNVDTIPQPVPDIIPQGEAITSTSSLPSFTPITLPPGSFTVQIVLDVREVRAQKDRDYVQNNLSLKGCPPIMRALEIGDVLWVAKVKDASLLTRLGAEGDEIVLDWIVERKRLDDLVSSIKGGRFHEQKFRLKKSGVKNVIYIIEEFNGGADKYEEAVESAIASTQVVNGYFVKKTRTLDDSIRYLVSLTKLLKSRYESQPLKLIPTKVITTQNYLPLLAHLTTKEPSTEYHITYSAFASLASKSETLTLRDVYLKMLMCTRGVTGEKALEIQKRWKTPKEFVEAFKRCEVDGEGGAKEEIRKRKFEMVSREMSGLVGRKKIQKVLSGKIAEVWGDL